MPINLASKHAKALTISYTPSTFKMPSTIMVQGCTSDAGKTVMVAGLCRWLANKYSSVAPFKPQNMALNSAVTQDGGEIGRAQALQARACKLEPHTDMNPILLKPSSDKGAQVIVHGHAIDEMQATDFHDYKKVAMTAVLDSHSRLNQQYQKIIVEGAGSPAEINLREGDIANMGFAEAVDCPVILIADIDRGGVFAHLVGTLELLSKSEQDRVIGFIINRFRGDIKLLESGLAWLEQRTKKPVLGVVPYLHDLFLDAEDAIASSQVTPEKKQFKIVVPVLPRISNHTDFDALRLNPDINLQFVPANQACPSADLIILPGSKNVISDLKTLRGANWHTAIERHLRYGGKVMGICGGFQMLGNQINDPLGIEANGVDTSTTGFGLLDAETNLKPGKHLHHVTGRLNKTFKNIDITGYEIHCGETLLNQSITAPLITLNDNRQDGAINQDNNVLGTYLHGLFDTREAAAALLAWAGLDTQASVSVADIREQQLDRLAACLGEHLNSDFLESLLS